MLFLGYLKTFPKAFSLATSSYVLERYLLTSPDFFAARVECQVQAKREKKEVLWESSWKTVFFVDKKMSPLLYILI